MRFIARMTVWAVFALSLVRHASAQDVIALEDYAQEQRTPRFLYAYHTTQKPILIDPSTAPRLRHRISLRFENIPLKQAIEIISRESGLRIFYSKDVIKLDSRVSLRADDITVAAALTEILFDMNVDVLLGSGDKAALVSRKARPLPGPQQFGVITGQIAEAETAKPIVGAYVHVENTSRGVLTDASGNFRIDKVPIGNRTLIVSSIGYARASRALMVVADSTIVANFSLAVSPTALSELVVTAIGEQRRVELGHVVGRIAADSLVREAPISSISELLTARVPGLQVFQESGSVGGRVNVRIRGPNSLTHDNQPIVIIDGLRYTTQEKTRLFPSSISDMEPTSPLNDLNPNDIESIEVVKGPSAATLYGTDAANGVIVITTKRGRPGPPRWNAYVKGSTTEIPINHFPDAYRGWGTVDGEPSNPAVSCTLVRLADGSCTQQDSIAVLPSALNDPQLTIFDAKPRWEYGMNVAGGRQDLRYYFSADFEDAVGPVQMPRAIAEQLMEERGLNELPDEWLEPNAFDKLNLRSNVSAVFGDRADLRAGLGYVRSNTRTLTSGSRVYDIAHYTSDYSAAGGLFRPGEVFAQTTNERVDRFFGGVSGNWQPLRWLSARATIGLDYTNAHRAGFVTRGDQSLLTGNSQGRADDTRRTQTTTTADFGLRTLVRRARISASTSIGAQYVRIFNSAFGATGRGLPRGGKAPFGATETELSQDHEESALLGGYVEETLGLNDRLFLTGAIRVDGASTFGRDYEAAAYPKIGLSWLLSDEPFLPKLAALNELRLRYAFGASGKQPEPDAARPLLFPGTVLVGGEIENAVLVFSPGNPDLRPERVREHEFGFDVSALSHRIAAELTWFRRRTVDQHITELGPTGRGVITTNLGLTKQSGFEAALTARVLDKRALTWDVKLQHSDYSTLLVDIGGGTPLRSAYGGYVEGFPLGARFQEPLLGFADDNGNGIIEAHEIQKGDTAVYMGESLPPTTQTLTSVLGFFNSRVRISALLERKSGFTQINPYFCGNRTCRAAVDPQTPLAEQARIVAALPLGAFPEPPIEKGDFTRLREVTAAFDLPETMFRRLPVRRGTLIVSARNLALWTDFSGADPEVGGGGRAGFATLPPTTIDPVAGGAAAGIPLGRVFSIRLDLGL